MVPQLLKQLRGGKKFILPNFPTSMKRTRGSSLTGGTGDYNPQTYTISGQQTAADTNSNFSFPTPIPRFGTGGSTTSPVIEILKVFFILDDITAISAQTSVIASVSTSDLGRTPSGINGLGYISDPLQDEEHHSPRVCRYRTEPTINTHK